MVVIALYMYLLSGVAGQSSVAPAWEMSTLNLDLFGEGTPSGAGESGTATGSTVGK